MGGKIEINVDFLMELLNAIDDPIFVKDQNHRWVFLNDAACELWGQPKDSLIGKSDYDLFPRGEADVYWSKDDEVLRSGVSHLNEETQTIDGVVHVISTKKSVLQNSRSGHRYIVGTIRDITDRKRAEDALREREAWMQSIFRAAPIGIGVVKERTLKRVNDQFCRMTGFAREELIDRDARFLYPNDEDYEFVGREKYAQLRTKGIGTVETRWKRKDGKVLDILLSSTLIDPFDPSSDITFTALDITERKATEAALLESSEKYLHIFEESPLGIALFDRRGLLVDLNKAFMEIFGIHDRACISGYRLFDAPHLSECQRALLRRGRRVRFEAEFDHDEAGKACRRAAGGVDPLSVEVIIAPIGCETEDGLIGYLAQVIDISDRKRSQRKRRELEEQLNQARKMEAIGQLAGGIAHDFNNLLTAILGYAEMLGADPALCEESRTGADEIRKSAIRAASLTQQLLAYSRKEIIQPKVMNINERIRHMGEMLRRLIGEHISLLTPMDPELGSIRADPGQIEQVILNLSVNARDAMPTGGTLTIGTRNELVAAGERNALSGVPPGRYVELTVRDTGRGMDDATKRHLFEPFFTTKEPGKGTGLGLFTVYGIVKQSRGHIITSSEVNRGTVFRVYFPRVDDESGGESTDGGKEPDLRGAESVLIVEDENAVRGLVETVLKSYGYRVLTAENGRKALELCAGREGLKPSLLVTDVIMPDMGGLELAARIQESLPGIRILYISGYTDDAVVHHGVLEEGFAFLQKPFNPKDLARKVREMLDAG